MSLELPLRARGEVADHRGPRRFPDREEADALVRARGDDELLPVDVEPKKALTNI